MMFMKWLVCILSIWVFIKNMSFAIYEYKVNENVIGSITVIVFNLFCIIFTNLTLFLR